MDVTRREFIGCTAAAMVAANLTPPAFAESIPHESITWIEGDPYLASVVEGGLGGGRGFDAARDQAMRFRTSPSDRDQYVLGLELRNA